MSNPLLDAALSYAARGWRVLPLHNPLPQGGCSCRRACGKNLGKHPRINAWDEYATTDPEALRRWWAKWPAANVGIACGEGSGLVVLDPDGEAGADSLRTLEARHGELPQTVESITGGLGRHLFFSHPGGVRVGNRQKLAPSLDARGDGGYIVAPPSLHQSGRRYEWDAEHHPADVGTAPLPPWLTEVLRKESGAWERRDDEGQPAPLDPILAGCGWLRHCRDDAGELGEAPWYAMLSIVGRCENGGVLAHSFSHPHPGYAAEATEAKLRHAILDTGPYRCETIRNDLDGEPYCSECIHWQRIKSPIALARGREAGLEAPPEWASGEAGFISEAPTPGAPPDPEPASASESPNAPPKPEPKRRRPRPAYLSAAELIDLDIPPALWAVPDIIPEGLTILAGKPKSGKSWMALQTAIAVATGGMAFGKIPVEPGEVLYLALEDTRRRMKSRLRLLVESGQGPAGLTIAVEFPRANQFGTQELDLWLTEHPRARLMIIDTFAKFRAPARANANAYDEDYTAVSGVKTIADRHSISALVIHHQRKGTADDVFDTISGSLGLTGAADGVAVLERKRGSNDGILKVTGREVEESELALQWDPHAAWTLMGEAQEYQRSREQQEVIELFKTHGTPLRNAEVAKSLDIAAGTSRVRLWRMAEKGLLLSRDGLYWLPQMGNGCNAVTNAEIDPFLSTD